MIRLKQIEKNVEQSFNDRICKVGLVSSRAIASLLSPGGPDKIISLIYPHFPLVSLIFPEIFFNFFLILVCWVGGRALATSLVSRQHILFNIFTSLCTHTPLLGTTFVCFSIQLFVEGKQITGLLRVLFSFPPPFFQEGGGRDR